MRTTTLPLLMGLFSAFTCAVSYAQDNSNPSVTPSTPLPGSPNTTTPAPPPAGPSGGPAGEEPSPFIFGIRQGLTGESNLFRAREGEERRDRIWTSGVHLGLDKSLGRQHFFADLQANANRYNKNERMNNTDYTANARWDWETIGRLSGTLSAQQRQALYRDTVNGTQSLERNQVRSTALGFQARLGLVTLWSLEAGVTASDNDYRGIDVDNRDMRQTSINAGVRYRPSSALTTRVGVRRTEGEYLGGGTVARDEFTRDDIDFITNWNASGASVLNSRLSATQEKHNSQGPRNTHGWTGALGWIWRPTGKITTDLDLTHDRSVGQADFDSNLTGGETSDSRASDIASLSITWAATAKLSFTPRASYARRKLDNSFSSGGSPTAIGTDTTVVGALAMSYTPFNALTLLCQVSHEKRKVGSGTVLSAPYKATVAGCNAEFAIR